MEKGREYKKENRTKIIRWSENIRFESGAVTNMMCMHGTEKEVRAYAERIAKEHGVRVETVV